MNFIFFLTSISLLGLVFIFTLQYQKNRLLGSYLFKIFTLIFSFFCLYFLLYTPDEPVVKGSESTTIFYVIPLYLSMIFGMFASAAYNHFHLSKIKRKKFDFGTFWQPFFASPIIFLPLLSAFQNIDLDLVNITIANIMILIVSFENGFFWKEHFDNRLKELKDDK